MGFKGEFARLRLTSLKSFVCACCLVKRLSNFFFPPAVENFGEASAKAARTDHLPIDVGFFRLFFENLVGWTPLGGHVTCEGPLYVPYPFIDNRSLIAILGMSAPKPESLPDDAHLRNLIISHSYYSPFCIVQSLAAI